MDQKSQEYLSEILTKNPEELSESEIIFLRARRSYLKNTQLEEYKSVLEDKKESPKKDKKDKSEEKAEVEETQEENQTSEEKSEPVKQHAKNSKTN